MDGSQVGVAEGEGYAKHYWLAWCVKADEHNVWLNTNDEYEQNRIIVVDKKDGEVLLGWKEQLIWIKAQYREGNY